MYVRTDGFGAWYDSVTFDRKILGDWARRLDPSLPADDNVLIARIAQTPGQGGGFVAGGQRMCLSNIRGGQSEPLRSSDVPCPPGSGGMTGEQVHELSADEIRRQIEEQQRREAAERARIAAGAKPRAVEVYGIVVDGTGAPVAGAVVMVGTARATTDAAGNFSVSAGVLPGTYAIAVTAADFLARRLEAVEIPTGVPFNAGTIVLIRSGGGGTGGGHDGDEYKSGSGTAPWYKNKWTYIIGGVVLVGGTAVVVIAKRGSRR